ncbi:MAG: hypothetical protein ACE5HT_12200 [Gemmatimonadales bacterium]
MSIKGRSIPSVALVLFLVGVMGNAGGLQDASVAAAACYNCDANLCLNGNWHDTFSSGGSWTGPSHSCYFGSCEGDGHTEDCILASLPADELKDLWVAMGEQDERLLARFAESHEHPLEINFARHAIQVVGCNDRVIANLPFASTGTSVLGD